MTHHKKHNHTHEEKIEVRDMIEKVETHEEDIPCVPYSPEELKVEDVKGVESSDNSTLELMEELGAITDMSKKMEATNDIFNQTHQLKQIACNSLDIKEKKLDEFEERLLKLDKDTDINKMSENEIDELLGDLKTSFEDDNLEGKKSFVELIFVDVKLAEQVAEFNKEKEKIQEAMNQEMVRVVEKLDVVTEIANTKEKLKDETLSEKEKEYLQTRLYSLSAVSNLTFVSDKISHKGKETWKREAKDRANVAKALTKLNKIMKNDKSHTYLSPVVLTALHSIFNEGRDKELEMRIHTLIYVMCKIYSKRKEVSDRNAATLNVILLSIVKLRKMMTEKQEEYKKNVVYKAFNGILEELK